MTVLSWTTAGGVPSGLVAMSTNGYEPDICLDDPTELDRWFLTAPERGNAVTTIDRRHPDGSAWSVGNRVRPLIHGATYFRELLGAVSLMGTGDLLMFTDWRGDRDQRLTGEGSEIGAVLSAAARRGVDVRGLLWRSHFDQFQFSAKENRRFGEEIEEAGGQCLLDMRVRPLGSHHQKLIILRHAKDADRDVAYIGGIDLCHGRRDDRVHLGDPQAQKMAAIYGARPPWHDIQVAVQGPAVGDAETVFRERWADAAPLSRNPVHLLSERLMRQDRTARALPAQAPDPPPQGAHAVQILLTYPNRHPGYPFAPKGERSIARAYAKVLSRAQSLVYVEDQYLWSREIATVFGEALRRAPELRLIVVIPRFPDQDGRMSKPPNLLGREPALRILAAAGGDRCAVYCLENAEGTPIYVHAKACIIDDTWACVGSDNANRRSWTHDSELSCAVLDSDCTGVGSWAQALRVELAGEHLGDAVGPDDLIDPVGTFAAFRESAARLDAWHEGSEVGPRPPGQLRAYAQPPLSWWTRGWSRPLYRKLYDPDGRPMGLRHRNEF